jgi:hypothetical protein
LELGDVFDEEIPYPLELSLVEFPLFEDPPLKAPHPFVVACSNQVVEFQYSYSNGGLV